MSRKPDMSRLERLAKEHRILAQALRVYAKERRISGLRQELDAGGDEELAFDDRILVASAGLVNAGKSSLLNALLDSPDHFAVADARCTRSSQEAVLGELMLVDTPGLDADDADGREAEETYRRADLILFVHSALQGEMDACEVAFLRAMVSHFPQEDLPFRLVPVLSKVDLARDELDAIASRFAAQWHEVVGTPLVTLHRVATATYMKGVREDKAPLQAWSQVPDVRAVLGGAVGPLRSAKASLFEGRLTQRLSILRALLQKERAKLVNARENLEKRAAREQTKLHEQVKELVGAIGQKRAYFENLP